MQYSKVKEKLVNYLIMTKHITFCPNICLKSKKFNKEEIKVTTNQIQILKLKIGNGNKKVINIFWSTLKEYYFNILLTNVQDQSKKCFKKLISINYSSHSMIMRMKTKLGDHRQLCKIIRHR